MRSLHRILLILLISLAISPLTDAANLDFQSKTMPSGLRVVYKTIPSNTVTARMVIPAGMLNEPRGLRGISHLLEHLIYRGSETSAATNFLTLLQDEGGTYNGATSLEQTEYYLSVPTENFPKALGLLLEMLFRPELDEKHIALEKKIIKVENVLRSDPGNTFFLYINELTEHQLDDSINSITREDLLHYHQQYYNPKEMTLIVTGNFKPDDLLKLAQGVPSRTEEDTFTSFQRLIRDLPSNVIVEDYLNGETYKILFGFELNKLSGKELTVAKALPMIFNYESYQYDHLTNRPLDYNILLFNLTDRFYLIFTYSDNQNPYSLEINDWHQNNLKRFCKYLGSKNFDKFLDWLGLMLSRDYHILSSDPFSLNDYYKYVLFEPSSLTAEDAAAIRRLSSKDIKNFVKKYLESKSYQKVVVKAL
ncbi:MAG: insulinase family protein [Firmicutes bacterium]|nr:insulinase family protein [Bacillota bacterium]